MSHLPHSEPSTQDVDAGGILDLVEALEAAPGLDPHALVLVRHGHVVARGAWGPRTLDRPRLLYSLSKTFTGTALGIAVGEGLLGLDDRVLDHLPELAGTTDAVLADRLLVRHVATMATGHEQEMLDAARAADPQDWVRGFLTLPPTGEPGEVFAYSQPATHTLAALLQRVTGAGLTAYLRPRLLDPLGIGDVAWQRDPLGREIGFSGLHARVEDVARLGQLWLDDGVVDGRRLLPEGWVSQASRAHVATGEPGDWGRGYGVQVWRSRHGYRGDGAFGQFCLVLPEQDAVLALFSQTQDMQRVLDLVWAHVLPALAGGGGPAADAALRARLGSLARPPVGGAPSPGRGPAGASPVAAGDEGPVRSLRLLPDGRVAVTVWGEELTLPIIPGHWTPMQAPLADRGEPLAVVVSGGWADGALDVDLVLPDTPHGLTLRLAEGSLTSRWGSDDAPLSAARLGRLRPPVLRG